MPYFDHSATTPLDPDVLDTMQEVQKSIFGNPSSIHRHGQKARSAIERARQQVADAFDAKPLEIMFTGGGSEANNLVLWNILYQPKKHVITSPIEHPSVRKVLKQLKAFGITVTEVPVDNLGRVNPDDIASAIRDDTGLITVMYANNEVGTIQPIPEIVEIAHSHNIPVHSDAVQVPGKLSLNIRQMSVDFMSFSAHKFYGPKGVGALFVKQGQPLRPLIIGGGQEHKLRAGTENVPGIAGLGVAAEKTVSPPIDHLMMLEQRLRDQLPKAIPSVQFNGHSDHHLPGLISVSFPRLTSDILLIQLDRRDISVSSGSACSSGTVEPSRVLQAMHIPNEQNTRTLRISFGKDNTPEEVDALLAALVEIHRNRSRS